jgi:hypothetical protein
MTGSSQAMITLAIATIKIVNTTRARKLNSSIHRRIRAPFFGRIPPASYERQIGSFVSNVDDSRPRPIAVCYRWHQTGDQPERALNLAHGTVTTNIRQSIAEAGARLAIADTTLERDQA